MRLSDYIAELKISDAAFAERIGVSRQALSRYLSGDRRPDWAVLNRIVQATDGHVTPNDFLDPKLDESAAAESGPATQPEAAA